jgi:hypothetical protein
MSKVIKKITKPISKVLDKIIPNEIKPALPYLAAVAPFMLPPGFGSGFASGLLKTQAAQQMAARALVSGAANLGSQLSQEGSEGDFSGISTLLAAGTGALSAPGAGDALSGMTTKAGLDPALGSSVQGDILANRSLLTKTKDFGLSSLADAADFLSVERGSGGIGDILRPGGTKAGLNMATAQAAAIPFTQGSTDLAMATARKALKDYEDELAAYELETGQAQTASDDARRTAIIAAMTAGQHSQDVIDETLNLLGLKDGGVVKMKDGGIMDLGGKEMDMRTGGFIPIGKKERADDVPARLSKNEFVMTADAVRAAGGGDVNEGAKRMYETMNRLEARA